MKPCVPLRVPPHELSDYPVFYDPCYYPDLWADVFASCEKVLSWIVTAIPEHAKYCSICAPTLRSSPEVQCSVEYSEIIGFIITLVLTDLSGTTATHYHILSLSDLESAKFQWCTLFGIYAPKPAFTPFVTTTTFDDAQLSAYMAPTWLFYPRNLLQHRLSQLSCDELYTCLDGLGIKRPRNKLAASRVVVDDLLVRKEQLPISWEARMEFCAKHSHTYPDFDQNSYAISIGIYFRARYGKAVYRCLSEPPFLLSMCSRPDILSDAAPWLSCEATVLVGRIKTLKKDSFIDLVKAIPMFRRPGYDPRSLTKSANLLIDHMRRRACHLAVVPTSELIKHLLAADSAALCSTKDLVSTHLIESVLLYEYGKQIVDVLKQLKLDRHSQRYEARRQERRAQKVKLAQEETEKRWARIEDWPQLVPLQRVHECLTNYRNGTIWKEPSVCAVCGQYQASAVPVIVNNAGEARAPMPERKAAVR
ncbi:hypothetical protein NP233_g11650 [Leucocoprinus birnbaumii]|uniref:Uncharacterized protein n=1 Tax=Leucocoprinus birnbaumii TaxID=56174 RepID=A0AAD5YK67_9AGAR|nr:hypothetical protein NP233_g11650 [Leucocoprinus birnbaumii]